MVSDHRAKVARCDKVLAINNALRSQLDEADTVYNVADPRTMMESGGPGRVGTGGRASTTSTNVSNEPAAKAVNTFNYQQRKKLEGKVEREGRKQEADSAKPKTLKPNPLDPAHAENMRNRDQGYVSEERRNEARKYWMNRLHADDYEGPPLDTSRYLTLRNEVIQGNPRQTEQYRDKCCEAVGLGPKPDKDRYAHFKHDEDFELVRWVVRRGSGCMWIPESPRTTVLGFKHRLLTRGPPVRVKLFRLSRADTEWIESYR